MQDKNKRTKTKIVALILAVVLSVVYATTTCTDYAIHAGAPLPDALLYMSMHGNVWHLLANLWSFLTIVFIWNETPTRLLTALAIASAFGLIYSLAPQAEWNARPVAGLSTYIYACVGLHTYIFPRPLRTGAYILMSIIVYGIIFPQSALLAHLFCYIAGLIIATFFTPIIKK